MTSSCEGLAKQAAAQFTSIDLIKYFEIFKAEEMSENWNRFFAKAYQNTNNTMQSWKD